MPQMFIRKTQMALAWFALIAAVLTAVVVVGSYLVSASQPYRGPSLFYFYVFFFTALISRKGATVLLIFALPLLPNLAIQAEYVLNPKVKYFIAYPGLDAIVGLFFGQCARSVCIDRNLRAWLKPPPWPFGLALLVIAVSCYITIDRNLWQSATFFSLFGVASNIFRFKHVLYGNSFSPFNDLLVYSGAVLLVICVWQALSESKNKDQFVFKPLMLGLIISSIWGIFQALTGFGLLESTIQYRAGTFGYSAVGFQPDIHAFAAHMLLGAVGLFGYLLISARNELHAVRLSDQNIVAITSLLSWLALILSKSRASLIFAAGVSIVWLIVYLKVKKITVSSKKLVLIAAILMIAILSLVFSGKFWLADILQQLQSADLTSFESLNRISVYRLEIFAGALRMFAQFPLMGIGQGNFFHLSSILDFMGSPWITQTGGENAHNYFLQTLAELGLVGALSFMIVFLWPFKHSCDVKKLLPASIAIFAVFLGNLYSHSLIIRENLYMLAVFVALLYVHSVNAAEDEPLISRQGADRSRIQAEVNPDIHAGLGEHKVTGLAIFLFTVPLVYLAYQEVSAAKNKFPFEYGSDCYRPITAYSDGWTSGRLIIPLEEGKSGVRLTVDQNQADATRRPVSVSLSILDKTGNSIHTIDYLNQVADHFSIQITIPESKKKEFQGGSEVMQLSKCFSPSNFGLKDDSRKLGVHLKSIEQL
jgi:O-antigen ligase